MTMSPSPMIEVIVARDGQKAIAFDGVPFARFDHKTGTIYLGLTEWSERHNHEPQAPAQKPPRPEPGKPPEPEPQPRLRRLVAWLRGRPPSGTPVARF